MLRGPVWLRLALNSAILLPHPPGCSDYVHEPSRVAVPLFKLPLKKVLWEFCACTITYGIYSHFSSKSPLISPLLPASFPSPSSRFLPFSAWVAFFIFLRLWYDYTISPFLFLPSNPPIYPSLLFYRFMILFSLIIACMQVYACTRIHRHRHTNRHARTNTT